MNEISRIMCVIDPTSTEQPAMRRAAWLAKNVGAKLELFVSCYNQYLSGERFFDSPSLEKARREVIADYEKHLEELAEPLRSSGLIVRTAATWDHPLYEGIVRHAVAVGADIVRGGKSLPPSSYDAIRKTRDAPKGNRSRRSASRPTSELTSVPISASWNWETERGSET